MSFYGFRNTCSIKQCSSSKPITNCWDALLGWLWLHIPSTHKGHHFRYVQAGNKCYLRAGAAACSEFKVSSSHPTMQFDLSRTSESFFQLPRGRLFVHIWTNILTSDVTMVYKCMFSCYKDFQFIYNSRGWIEDHIGKKTRSHQH